MDLEALWKSKFPGWEGSLVYIGGEDPQVNVGGYGEEQLCIFKDRKAIPFAQASDSDLKLIKDFLGLEKNQLGDDNPMIPIGDDLPSDGGAYEDSGDNDMIPL